jgi:hypothetical protein
MTDVDRTDRLVRLDGSLIEGDLTPEEAIEKKRELSEQGISWRHHRWTGDRAGWCSVAGADYGPIESREKEGATA